MTSSLVGSEMCIRDRHLIVRWERRGAPEALNSMQARWHMFMGKLLRLTSVSYTHLTLPTICSV
eukprot:41004-Prorocentrum_lima.AAC.1